MLGFFADYESGEPATRDHELEDVRWFARDELEAIRDGRVDGLRAPAADRDRAPADRPVARMSELPTRRLGDSDLEVDGRRARLQPVRRAARPRRDPRRGRRRARRGCELLRHRRRLRRPGRQRGAARRGPPGSSRPRDPRLEVRHGHEGPRGRPAGPRADRRAYVRWACEHSLRRLRVDTIDLYQYHQPDGETPIEETLGALGELVSEGKVRYVGCSNFSADQLIEAAPSGRGPALRDAAERVQPAASARSSAT